MNTSAWTIPFNGINFICWTDKSGQKKYRVMTSDEERVYFALDTDKEKYIATLCE